MKQVDIVLTDNAIDLSLLQDLDRPVLMFLGSGVFDIIQMRNIDQYYFVDVKSIDALRKLIDHWDTVRMNYPVKALFVHEKYMKKLHDEKIHQRQKRTAFSLIPLLVFSTKENKTTKELCFSIDASDYIYGTIKFPVLISKVSFARKLKRFGVTKQDAILVKDTKYEMYFLKRLFDIAFSSTCLLIFSPIMILVAIIIRLESKGPIFYISQRAGNNYKVFDFYKFRSMQPDADKLLEKLKETSNQYQDGDQFVKIKDDPRITRFGHFLRKSSVDELPQLLNVLKGDMSIVGNRPLPLYEAELLMTDDHAERFLAPAGITGLWQTLKRGKGDMSSEERIILDRIYVRKNSLAFDLKLIFKTLSALVQSENV